jgi:hypothetical protein
VTARLAAAPARHLRHLRRLPARRRRRLGTAAALVGVALLLGGLGGVLIAFLAALLGLDAVLPVPGVTATAAAADDRFHRLVAERRRAAMVRRVRGLPPERLELLDDREGWAATAVHRECGVEAIPVASIDGTVEPLKARAFDSAFRPDASAHAHWRRLWLAQLHGEPLPPIEVYRVGDRHVVRDGHHRVSVARSLGLEMIDADVVELVRRARPAAPGCRAPGPRASAARTGDRRAGDPACR